MCPSVVLLTALGLFLAGTSASAAELPRLSRDRAGWAFDAELRGGWDSAVTDGRFEDAPDVLGTAAVGASFQGEDREHRSGFDLRLGYLRPLGVLSRDTKGASSPFVDFDGGWGWEIHEHVRAEIAGDLRLAPEPDVPYLAPMNLAGLLAGAAARVRYTPSADAEVLAGIGERVESFARIREPVAYSGQLRDPSPFYLARYDANISSLRLEGQTAPHGGALRLGAFLDVTSRSYRFGLTPFQPWTGRIGATWTWSPALELVVRGGVTRVSLPFFGAPSFAVGELTLGGHGEHFRWRAGFDREVIPYPMKIFAAHARLFAEGAVVTGRWTGALVLEDARTSATEGENYGRTSLHVEASCALGPTFRAVATVRFMDLRHDDPIGRPMSQLWATATAGVAAGM